MHRSITAILSSLALLHIPSLSAQTGSMRVTVPSPTAASLGKFGEVPVSLYTGVPDITVPIFTAKGKTLELPITLKYHASGIRVQDLGGWAGIGWTVEAGGVITRTVRGLADESTSGYANTGNTWYQGTNWTSPSQTIINQVVNETLDGEPDLFFFSFAGRSGQFVMGPTSDTGPVEYRAVPYQDLLIDPGPNFASWTITAEDGTRYTFGATETNTDYNITYPGTQIPAHYGDSYVSAWYLTEIRSPGGDVITLTYASYSARHRMDFYREEFDQVVTPPGGQCVPSYSSVTNEYVVSGRVPDSIKTAAHTITFTTTLRTDALNPTNGAQQEPRLDKIKIATPTGTVLRQFQFDHDYSTGRLTLKNVYEQDAAGDSLPPYSFTYSGPALPSVDSYSLDHFGYYNGKTNNSPVPWGITPSGAALPGADREADSSFSKAGILTKITYPTGGYAELIYEASDYGSVGAAGTLPKAYGPEQDSSAASTSGFTGPVTNPFAVGGTETIFATVDVDLSPPGCGQQMGCPYAEVVGQQIFWESGTYYLALAPGNYTAKASDEYGGGWATIHVRWRDLATVTKKLGGGERLKELRTADAMGTITTRKYIYTLQGDPTRSSGVVNREPTYSFQYSSPECQYFSRSAVSKLPLGSGPPVGYREVTVWLGASGEFGKTRHTFNSVLDAADIPPFGPWPGLTETSQEWRRGQETGSTEYNASGQVQQQRINSYFFSQGGGAPNYRTFHGLSIHAWSAGTMGSNYYYNDFEIRSGWAYQNADTTTHYAEGGTGGFSTATTFVYGSPAHIQPTEIVEISSTGTQRITRMKYPGDYTTGSGNPEAVALTAMQGTAHMHSPIIERWIVESVGGAERLIQGEITTYKTYLTGQILPYQHFILNAPGVTP